MAQVQPAKEGFAPSPVLTPEQLAALVEKITLNQDPRLRETYHTLIDDSGLAESVKQALKIKSPTRMHTEVLESVALDSRVKPNLLKSTCPKRLFITEPKGATKPFILVKNLKDADLDDVGYLTGENSGQGIDALEIRKLSESEYDLNFIQMKMGSTPVNASTGKNNASRSAYAIVGHFADPENNPSSILAQYVRAFRTAFGHPVTFKVKRSVWVTVQPNAGAVKLLKANHFEITLLKDIWSDSVLKYARNVNLPHIFE